MVVLQLGSTSTFPASAAISLPYKLLYIIRYRATHLWARSSTHGNHCLGPFDSLLLTLLARYEQGVDLVGTQSIVIPVKAFLELP